MTMTPDSTLDARRRRTVVWIVSLATVGLIFDGYDLVVYGTVVSTFLRDPSHIGNVTPAIAGALGSYALVGVLVGALLAGTVGDILGRRKVMLFAYAPKGKKNLCNAITYSGVPLGSLLAALLAILLLQHIGWRGMFFVGALPLVTLLPLAYFKMPESVAWLASRRRLAEARAISERTGVEIPEAVSTAAGEIVPVTEGRAGFAGLFSGTYIFPTILLGLMSATALMLVYSLNTWLPELMLRAGFNAKGSLSFLLVLNGGAVLGALAGSRVADRFGPKLVVAGCFAIGAASLVLLTLGFPLAALLAIVAVVGLGTSGTQTLIYGFVANYYRTNVRGAGVAWCAGFGRLGGVGGPLLGGFLIGAGLALDSIFYVLAGLGLLGVMLTLLVPIARRTLELHTMRIEPTPHAGPDKVAAAVAPTT